MSTLFATVRVNLYMNERDYPFLSDAECDKIAEIVELAAWEAVENDLQERLDIAFPKQFTVKIEVD